MLLVTMSGDVTCNNVPRLYPSQYANLSSGDNIPEMLLFTVSRDVSELLFPSSLEMVFPSSPEMIRKGCSVGGVPHTI